MADVTTSRGTTLSLPPQLYLADEAAPGALRRGGATLDTAGAARRLDAVGTSALLAGILSDEGIEEHDAFEIAPASRSEGVRRSPDVLTRRSAEPIRATVEVAEGRGAAILIERDGVFAWVFPDAEDAQAATRRAGSGARPLTFTLAGPQAANDTLRRGGGGRKKLFDWARGQVVDRIKATVITFVAGRAVTAAQRIVERNVEEGLVTIGRGDPATWLPGATPITLPASGRPVKLLLAIHGTFSSTRGSFGALALTAAGQSLIAVAQVRYDALLGFDHYTLRDTPEENAERIHQVLTNMALPEGSTVDILAYSRGGLVARVLAERLAAGPKSLVAKVVFVGCTNGGTALADVENWSVLLDLYTNLAVAAGRGLSLLGAPAAGTVVAEAVKALGAFVEALAERAIGAEMVPGLAAMAPGSPLVSSLNTPDPVPAVAADYFAIGSDFEPTLLAREGSASFPARLVQALVDLNQDLLMGEPNDLVVDTEAMGTFGPLARNLLADRFADENGTIYHTNYFADAGVVTAIKDWLSLEGTQRQRQFETLSTDLSVGEVLEKLRDEPPEKTVLLVRPDVGYYVRSVAEMQIVLGRVNPSVDLLDGLELHESGRAEETDRPLGARAPGGTGFVRVVSGAPIEAVPATSPFAFRPVRAAPTSSDGGRRGDSPALSHEAAAEPDDFELEVTRPAEPAELECHFGAEMADTCPLGTPAELTVTLSREALDFEVGATAARTSSRVRTRDWLTIEVVPRLNAAIVGASVEHEVPVPAEGAPDYYDFRVEGLSPGLAEVWVDVRRGARRLARMVLQPTFVSEGTVRATTAASTGQSDPPLVELKIFEIEDGRDENLRLIFDMESRDLDIRVQSKSLELSMSRSAYIASLYERLEGQWGANADDFEAFMRSLRSFGAELYETLVPEPIRHLIWEHRERIGAIEVISHEPFIPWEVLHVKEPGAQLSPSGNVFLAELGLVRWIANAGWPPAALRVREGKAWHVVPDYALQRLKLAGAANERALVEGLFAARACEARSSKVVDRLWERGTVDLMHFACHGEAQDVKIRDAALLMMGRTDAVSGKHYADSLTLDQVNQYARLRHEDGGQPIVFLNACQTGKAGRTLTGTGGMAHAFINTGAGLFVGALWSVGDTTALTFARVFYEALKAGHSLTEAVRAGRLRAKEAREPTWLAYTVYGHPYARLAGKG